MIEVWEQGTGSHGRREAREGFGGSVSLFMAALMETKKVPSRTLPVPSEDVSSTVYLPSTRPHHLVDLSP